MLAVEDTLFLRACLRSRSTNGHDVFSCLWSGQEGDLGRKTNVGCCSECVALVQLPSVTVCLSQSTNVTAYWKITESPIRQLTATTFWLFQGIHGNITGIVKLQKMWMQRLKNDTAESRSIITSRKVQVESRGSVAGLCGPWPRRGSRWPLVPGHSDTPRWCIWSPWITPPPGRASGPDLLNNKTQTNVSLLSCNPLTT